MHHKISLGVHWDRLFGVKCLNSYYKDGETKDFEFIPTNKTAILFKNYKLFFKSDKSGFTIYCNKMRLSQAIGRSNGEVPKLTFLIKNKNSYLLNYTDLSFEDNNKVNYLNNLTPNKDKDTLLLHQSKNVDGKTKVDLYNVFQALRMDEISATSKVLDAKNKEVKKEIWYEERGDAKYIRLRDFKEGKYTLKSGKNERQFYVIDYVSEPIWGILDVYLTDLNKDYTFIAKSEIEFKEYTIRMSARSTYWKYFIISQDKNIELKVEDAKVSYNGESLGFSKPKKVNLSNGALAFAIESQDPIELQELTSVTDKLELKLKRNNKWHNKTLRIPKPDVKTVKPDRESKKIYSTTYIYV